MTLGETIKQYREKRGLSKSELAKLSDIHISYVGKLEQGHYKLTSSDTITKLAKALKVNPEELYRAAGLIHDKKGIYEIPQKTPDELISELQVSMPVAIPIVAEIHAPQPEVLDYAYWAKEKAVSKNIVGLKVKGFCLEPDIHDGDVIFIDKDGTPDIGKILLCYHNGKESLKLIRYSAEPDLEQCELIGIIVEVNRRL